MKVLSSNKLCSVLLCVLWSAVTCAVGDDTHSPLASSRFGVTGEPGKIDTAYGNLGDIGPSYGVPSSSEHPNPEPASTEYEISPMTTGEEGTEPPQVTSKDSNSTASTQLFNTSGSPVTLTSATTEKSIVPNTTPKTAANESASTASDRETTVPIEMSTAETGYPTLVPTNATLAAIPGEQSVSPSQTFETGTLTKPTAGPEPITAGNKPGKQNGTATVEPNSSIVVQPLTTIYCLGSIVLLISKAMY